jgi:hypothetical protein
MTEIDPDDEALTNAALWIRAYYCIPEHESIQHLFENEFKCKIHINLDGTTWKVWFPNDEDYNWFMLKWS